MPTDPFQALQDEKNEKSTKCKFCDQLHEKLDKEQLTQLLSAMNRKKEIHTDVVVRILRSWGITCSETTVVNHRNRSTKGSGSRRDLCMKRLEKAVAG